MHTAFPVLVAIIAFVIVLNFVMLFMRLKRAGVTTKRTKRASSEEEAAIRRHREIQRRLDREQDELSHRVEMRNRMFELYDEVRRRAAECEHNSGDSG